MSANDREAFDRELAAGNQALKLLMEKGENISWPEARPFYVQRYSGWMKDGEPHNLIKMLDDFRRKWMLPAPTARRG